jgi:hypothetical protein
MFSNGRHLECRAGLSNAIVKGYRPRTITAKFGLTWFRGDLHVEVNDGWQTLAWPLARGAKHFKFLDERTNYILPYYYYMP